MTISLANPFKLMEYPLWMMKPIQALWTLLVQSVMTEVNRPHTDLSHHACLDHDCLEKAPRQISGRLYN